MSTLNLNDLPNGRAVTADHLGEPDRLILLRRGDRIMAWLNCCPHQGRALNYAPGKILQTGAGELVCAAHGAMFRPADGVCTGGPCEGAALTPVDLDSLLHEHQS